MEECNREALILLGYWSHIRRSRSRRRRRRRRRTTTTTTTTTTITTTTGTTGTTTTLFYYLRGCDLPVHSTLQPIEFSLYMSAPPHLL